MNVTLLLSSLPLLTPLGPTAPEIDGKDLSKELEELRAETGATGLVALAYQDGEVAAWGAAGVRVQGSDAAITIDDPIHIGSCAKAMTATLIARLVEEGKLSWETTIADGLPELAPEIDEGFHAVTVEELLQHRGGIAERRRPELGPLFPRLVELEGKPAEVRLGFLKDVLAKPPLPPATGGFDYSNYGYMTAGAIAEERMGKPWEELIVEKVFVPLGMKSAGVGSPAGSDVPVGHRREGDGWKPLPPGPKGALPDAMGPAGLIHVSLPDWAKFVAEHMAGERGDDGFLKAETYERLHRDPESSRYAAGWGKSHHSWSWGEGAVFEHNGSDNTWFAVVFAMPEWDLTVLAAANCAPPAGDDATRGARVLLLESLGFQD